MIPLFIALLAAHNLQAFKPFAGETIVLGSSFLHGKYYLPAKVSGDETDSQVVQKEKPIITIEGKNITADFTGVTIRGDLPGTLPDHRRGIAVRVHGDNITIKGLRARGYKIALLAEKCKNLKLINCDFSDNWKQHLLSTPEKENEADWQSYHHNENHEWFRYGAGIYLDQCSQFLVEGCKVLRGQCGLMLNLCNHGKVWNSNFSFNSGLGIGLYRSSDNNITNNKVDWDVRGYSYNNYYRGQDSASILLFEQCNRNLIAYNSMTQGGDGFFLFAGFQTLDSGEGGCNDNLVAFNDFSGAITNGIEATFSRNQFVGNLVLQCWHGVWAGYSFDTLIKDNIIGYCDQGLAIEHGSNIKILNNIFTACRPAISLWASPPNGISSKYLAARPSPSNNYQVIGNRFNNCTASPVVVANTQTLNAYNNTITSNLTGTLEHWILKDGKSSEGGQTDNTFIHTSDSLTSPSLAKWTAGSTEYGGNIPQAVEALGWNPIQHPSQPSLDTRNASGLKVPAPPVGGQDPYLGGYKWRGRRYVIIGQWGPYDFERPMFQDLGKGSRPSSFLLRVLSPNGRFVINHVSGGELISAAYGSTGDLVQVQASKSNFGTLKIDATFTFAKPGGRDAFGEKIPAGKSVQFSFSKNYSFLSWKAWYFLYDSNTDPLAHPKAFARLLRSAPTAVQNLTELKLVNDADWVKGVRGDHYAIVAQAKVKVSSGNYHLDLICDDGAKASIDGQPIPFLDSNGKLANTFRYQGATEYTAEVKLSAGTHLVEVTYFQIDGGRTLQFTFTPWLK